MIICEFLIHTNFLGPNGTPTYNWIQNTMDMMVESYQLVPYTLGGDVFGFVGTLVLPVLYDVHSNDLFVLHMHKDKPTIPANMSEQDECAIRAAHGANQCNRHIYMAFEVYHKANLTAALHRAYLVGICIGNMGMAHLLVQEVFG